MDRVIRALAPQEAEARAAVIRAGNATMAAEFVLTRENCPTGGAFLEVDRLRGEMERGKQVFVCVCHGEILGAGAIEYQGEDLFSLEKLAVLPEHRHRGIGRELMDYAVRTAAGLGGRRISIGIIEENARLKNGTWITASGQPVRNILPTCSLRWGFWSWICRKQDRLRITKE